MPLRRAGAEALLAAVACAALCASAWVDAAPVVFSGEDGSVFNPSGCGLLRAPGRVPLEEILKLHRFSNRKEPSSDFAWTEEALLGSGDVEDNTLVEVSAEDEAAAPTPSRPWSSFFGGFPEYPDAAVPVYRGSSVGGKAWYRGVAAPAEAPADDTPTRLTISLLDDDLADLPVDEDVGTPQGLDQDAGKLSAEDLLKVLEGPPRSSTLDLDDIIVAALDLPDEGDDVVTVDAKDVEKDDGVVTDAKDVEKVDAKDVEKDDDVVTVDVKDDDISIDSKELEKAFDALADLVLRAVGEDADLVTDDAEDVEKDEDVVTVDAKDVEKDEDVVTVDAKDVEKDEDVVTVDAKDVEKDDDVEGLQSFADDLEKFLARRYADASTDNAVDDDAVVLGV